MSVCGRRDDSPVTMRIAEFERRVFHANAIPAAKAPPATGVALKKWTDQVVGGKTGKMSHL